MYTGLLHTHSSVRYLVLLLLIAVIVKSLLGFIWQETLCKGRQYAQPVPAYLYAHSIPGGFAALLRKLSLHVKFGPDTMSDKFTRYWTVEHIFGMLIAVVLITVARSTSKRMTDDTAKHKRLFILNTIALVIIVIVIVLSGRPLIGH